MLLILAHCLQLDHELNLPMVLALSTDVELGPTRLSDQAMSESGRVAYLRTTGGVSIPFPDYVDVARVPQNLGRTFITAAVSS